MAALTNDSFRTVGHGAVIVECSDGFVLIESTHGPVPISIPFGQTRECDRDLVTALQPGSTVPLTIIPMTDDPPTLQFCINIANADDLVMKHYIMGCLWRKNSIQIGIFDPDRRRRKFVLLCPSESKIVFKDTTTIGEQRTKEFAFSEALRPEWRQKLHDFMQPQYCRSVPGFQTPPDTLHRQIVEFVSQAERVKRLFDQTDLDETM